MGNQQKHGILSKIIAIVFIFIIFLQIDDLILNSKRAYTGCPSNVLGLMAFSPNNSFTIDKHHPTRPKITIKTNSYGYRDEEWSLENSFNRPRIVIIGDSYVAGVGIPEESGIIDRCLEKELRKHDNKNWEVINAGFPATSFRSYFMTAEIFIKKTKPKVIIIENLGDSDWSPMDPGLVFLLINKKSIRFLTIFDTLHDFEETGIKALFMGAHVQQIDKRKLEFQRLTALAQKKDMHLIIWNFQRNFNFFDSFKDEKNVCILTWPKKQFPKRWENYPGMAVPIDGHPLGKANRIIAKIIAKEIMKIYSLPK